MTDREYRELLAELARKEAESRAEIDRQLKETSESIKGLRESHTEAREEIKELRVFQQEVSRQIKEQWKQIKEQGKQIGGLGEKFGGFTEGMAFPSMKRVLRERFRMEVISLRHQRRNGSGTMELDVFAYSNSRSNEAFIVEVKSHLREEGYERLLQVLHDFPTFFPEHSDKRLFGILACVDAPEHLERRVLRSGIYLAKIHDETFSIQVSEGFTPKSYQN